MHSDLIPFVILGVVTLGAGFALKGDSKAFAAIFVIAGLAPMIAAVSNSERWPIPFELELVAFYCSSPLLVIGSFLVGTKKVVSGSCAVAFWILSPVAICVSIYSTLLVFGLSRLP